MVTMAPPLPLEQTGKQLLPVDWLQLKLVYWPQPMAAARPLKTAPPSWAEVLPENKLLIM